MNRRAAVLRAVAALTLGLLPVACSGGSGGSQATVTPASPSVVTQTVTTGASTSASAPASSAAHTSTSPTGDGTVLCTPTVTVMSAGPGSGAAGHFGLVVTVRNASAQPCRTSGYPGVALLDAAGAQILQAQRTPNGYIGGVRSGPAPMIVLQPGQLASALIEGVNAQTGPCPTSPALLFTLPDNTDSTRLLATTQACPGLQVHPMVPGTTGDLG